MSEHSPEKDAGLWIVTELSLSLSEAPPEGGPHPERNPVGPFLSRSAADEWASDYVSQFRSGSWSVALLWSPPQTSGGEVAPGDADDAGVRAHVQTPRRSPTRADLRAKAIRVTTSASAGWTRREVEFARAIIALLDYIDRDIARHLPPAVGREGAR